MDQQIDLSTIKALSVPDRILVVEEIWDTIADEHDSIPLTPAQRAELDRRLEDLEKFPEEGSSWDDVEARIIHRT